MTEDGRHQEVLDEVIQLASRMVNDNSEMIRAAHRAGDAVVGADRSRREDLQARAARHSAVARGAERPIRAIRCATRFDESLHTFIERLNTSPEFAARVDAWKEEFLDNDAARRFSASLWQEGKEALARYAANPESDGAGRDRARADGVRPESARRCRVDGEDGRIRGGRRGVSRRAVQDEVADLIATHGGARGIRSSRRGAWSWRSVAICSSSASTARSSAGWRGC